MFRNPFRSPFRSPFRTPFGGAPLAAAALLALANPALAQPVLITAPLTINPGDATITPTAGGPAVPLASADITVRAATLTVNGRFTIRSLALEQAAVVSHSPAFFIDYSGGKGTDLVNGLWLNVLPVDGVGGFVTISGDSRIDVTGRGYPSAQGPGAGGQAGVSVAGCAGSGAHGGNGARGDGASASAGDAYGSYARPATHGSGGGRTFSGLPGAGGGGCVRLTIDGSLALHGRVVADGAAPLDTGGAGAGGSIWIEAGSISGAGFVTANGGRCIPCEVGGGGGRIRAACAKSTYTGQWSARSGAFDFASGAGSLYLLLGSQPPELIYDNGVLPGRSNLPEPLIFDTPTNVIVRNGSHLRTLFEVDLVILTPGDISIAADSSLTAFGFAGAQGPGAGTSTPPNLCAAGAGHGGAGSPGWNGAPGGGVYGDPQRPVTHGSGGGRAGVTPGAYGGGVIRLVAGGALLVDGPISATAASLVAPSGAGAGGSIWITAGAVTGSGSIRADGGHNFYVGCHEIGGGGGRIAIDTCVNAMPPANISVARGAATAGDGTLDINPTALVIEDVVAPDCRGGAFTILATTTAGATFQWLKNGVELTDGPTGHGSTVAGAHTGSLTITNVQATDRAVYTVRVDNVCGLVTSDPVTLAFCAADHNCDGVTNSTDVSDFINAWFQDQHDGTLITDWDADGVVNSTDVSSFINTWFEDTAAGCA